MTTAHPTGGIRDAANLPASRASTLALPVPADSPVSEELVTVRARNGTVYTRKKPEPKEPKDSRLYKIAMATVALKAQGLKTDEIAEQLGVTKNTIITYMKRATAKGYLNLNSFDDPDDQLEFILKNKVVRNLNRVLDETMNSEDETAPSNRAFEASLEVAKGTGLLKQHQVVKADNQTSVGLALRVQVDMPAMAGASLPTARVGSIGGQPAFDAEIINDEKE